MIYSDVFLEKNYLLSFFVRKNNGFTNSFISNQGMNIFIPYNEYLSLIKDLVRLDIDILKTSLDVYKLALSYGDFSMPMLKIYYYDIAIALLEELSKSYKDSLSCTRIFCKLERGDYPVTKVDLNIDKTAEFVSDNFSKEQIRELSNMILDISDIPFSILKETRKDLSGNTNMYLLAMSYLGIYKFNNNILIS